MGRLSRSLDRWSLLLLLALVVGTVLRLLNLPGPSLSHPEIYIPGIDLIAGLTEPPPRHAFLETLSWHFCCEPHPPGYFMAMWAWTKFAGTSVFALRFPAAGLGVATIWLLWRVGEQCFGRAAGAVAALLLALNGFHIYWSQMARMYAASCFFAMLATLLFISCFRSGYRRPWLEVGYVLTVIAGTQSDELFWAIPALHVLWTALVLPVSRSPLLTDVLLPWQAATQRLAQLPAIAMALASPELVLAAHGAREGAAPNPAPRFLIDYADYGFSFESSEAYWMFPSPPLYAVILFALSAVLFAFLAVRITKRPAETPGPGLMPFASLLAAALAGAVLVLLLAALSPTHHRGILLSLFVVPLACLWLPALAASVRPLLSRWLPALLRGIDILDPQALLIFLLAFAPALLFYVASVKMSVLAPRAFLNFTPFLLLLVSAGLLRVRPFRWAGATAISLVLILCIASSVDAYNRPHGPCDYKQSAAIIRAAERPDDEIMLRSRYWGDSPLVYYLPHARYVTEDRVAQLASPVPPRIWMVKWDYDQRNFGFTQLAAAKYVQSSANKVPGGEVLLYLHVPGSARR